MLKSALASSITFAIAGITSISVMAVDNEPTYSSSSELHNVHLQCIVRFHDNLPSSEITGRANNLLAKANKGSTTQVKLKHVYQHSIKGFTISMPCAAAQRAFGDDTEIDSFTPDSIITINRGKPIKPGKGDSANTVLQSTPWGVTRVGGSHSAVGMRAWVIDTGIDLSNQDLHIDSSVGFSAFTKGKNAGMNDGHGHGTHVAGTIAAIDNDIDVVGVAAGATVVPIKVLDSRGSGSTSGVIAGIDHVAAHASAGDCANMSLGGGISPSLDAAVLAASHKGIFFVLAAGNDSDDANNHSPARVEGSNIFTISAIDITDTMPSWSNWGNPPVDFSAPGVNVLSLKRGGGTSTMSGTSMAAPAACGVILYTGGSPTSDGTAKNDPDNNPDLIIHF
ncbi:S8 family serine peptidase [Shewanella surugensis]|uniref:S8 family serine peptidase n=1 Tax=Shewanella surugensis TaxID=212020 RepID=A0ABT0L691_9GAMM|nr:S8 family serine peptidase [Shewanella surugensis]MCL1123000.1 S8 family serine peptidase [Shewanella surugensis]